MGRILDQVHVTISTQCTVSCKNQWGNDSQIPNLISEWDKYIWCKSCDPYWLTCLLEGWCLAQEGAVTWWHITCSCLMSRNPCRTMEEISMLYYTGDVAVTSLWPQLWAYYYSHCCVAGTVLCGIVWGCYRWADTTLLYGYCSVGYVQGGTTV